MIILQRILLLIIFVEHSEMNGISNDEELLHKRRIDLIHVESVETENSETNINGSPKDSRT